jgi:hypothetical protein
VPTMRELSNLPRPSSRTICDYRFLLLRAWVWQGASTCRALYGQVTGAQGTGSRLFRPNPSAGFKSHNSNDLQRTRLALGFRLSESIASEQPTFRERTVLGIGSCMSALQRPLPRAKIRLEPRFSPGFWSCCLARRVSPRFRWWRARARRKAVPGKVRDEEKG